MNTREQFGDYLLLKKLSEDPLGESFRAGRVASQGLDQVVLLRVFNGPGIDANRLWEEISGRRQVHEVLSSPNIGAGVDLGQVRNVPYVAYDYVSGKNLESLLEQAVKRRHPVPSDHALLIAERAALALAVAYESRLGQERVLHGFLVPQLVMISNEGETRVLGFEAAPGLRQALNGGSHPLSRYLAPEARQGEPAHKADDVYSLAAMLLELLTGRPAPSDEAAIAQAIEGAELQPDGSPLPAELKQLLYQSLTPRSQRIADVISWHKTVSKLMFEGQFSPTTFNLAFYMHNLFRDDIERESQEIEVERTMEIPAAAVAAAQAGSKTDAGSQPGQPAGQDLRETTGVREDTGVIRDRYGIEADASSGKKKALLGALAAVVILGLGTGLFLFVLKPGSSEPRPPEPATAAAAVQAAPSPEVEEARIAAERAVAEEQQRELEERIREMVEQRIEATSREYEQDLSKLQAELEAQRQRVAEAQAAQLAAQARATEAQAAETSTAPASQPAVERPAADRQAEVTSAATGAQPAPATPPAASESGVSPALDQVASTQLADSAQTAEAAPASTEPPARPTIRRGDVVALGTPGSVPPRRIDMRDPRYPPQARRMRQEATVVVRALVSEEGRVLDVELAGQEVGFGMDQEALSVARTARYEPATMDGVPVKMWVTLRFPFQL